MKWTSPVNNTVPSSVFIDLTGGADDPNRIVLWSYLLTQDKRPVNFIDRRLRISELMSSGVAGGGEGLCWEVVLGDRW